MSCAADHRDAQPDDTDGESLFRFVDTSGVRCMNERVAGSCRNCIRPFANKQDAEGAHAPDAVSAALDLDGYQKMQEADCGGGGAHVAVCPCVGDPRLTGGAGGPDPGVERTFARFEGLVLNSLGRDQRNRGPAAKSRAESANL